MGDSTGPLNIGNTEFNGTYSEYHIKLGRHGNSGSYPLANANVNATNASFSVTVSSSDFWHYPDDSALGIITWE